MKKMLQEIGITPTIPSCNDLYDTDVAEVCLSYSKKRKRKEGWDYGTKYRNIPQRWPMK